MNKKIVVLTMSYVQSKYEVGRVMEEAKKMGVEMVWGLYRDLSFRLNNGKSEIFLGEELMDGGNTAGVWFRVAGTISGKYTESRNLLIRLLGKEGVFCANGVGYLNWPRMGKIAQHGVYIENDIPVVPTKIFFKKDQVNEKVFAGWQFPIISKYDRGYQGKSVRKFDDWEEVEKFLDKIEEKDLGTYLWQKCLPTKWDLRIIVLDGKAIGAMKRSAVGEEFRSNFSLGGAVEKWELNDGDKLIAEKVAKVCGLDYCGVDIMKDEAGNSYVLEVNRACQFQGFEKATGINVAKLVVEMLAESH